MPGSLARMSWTIFWTVAGHVSITELFQGVGVPTFGQRQVVVAAELAVRHGGGMRSGGVLALGPVLAPGCALT
jgi:hypothetical protein